MKAGPTVTPDLHMRNSSLRTAPVSPMYLRVGVWILIIPVIQFAVQGLFSFFESDGDARGLLGKLLLPGICYGIVLWSVTTRLQGVLRLAGQMKWLTCLAMLTVVSALWSQEPLRSVETGFVYVLDTLFAFSLVTRFDPEEQMSFVTISGTTIALLGIAVVLLLPQYGLDNSSRTPGAWRGLFQFRTGNALVMSFLITPALVIGRRAFNYPRLCYLILVLLVIIKAQAASAVLVLTALCLALGVLHLSYRIERRSLAALAIVICPVVIVLAIVGYPYLPSLFQLLGRDPTLTGRTEIWASLFHSVAKRPLLGYGYHAFWLGLTGESTHAILAANWIFGYAHNGMLEIVLQLGFIGLAVFLVTLAQAFRNAWICYRADRSSGTEWYITLLLLTVFYNVSEETVLWPSTLLSILYIVACTGLANAAKAVKERERESTAEPEPPLISASLGEQPREVFA